ncbi:hypothetical protein [Gemmatimonas groenlandica]|uniref:Uncharacterized protein n=1 Tax=Gemmatimonas groenlandica TaxID=2732249 RepID=A0A6M4IPD0_9BACT|nr:hypothetical protein [Gemmatimonas groenlandica]QJR36593.1 hypothetical protein HKW67_14280 [Gemmatimonas groenlandica]
MTLHRSTSSRVRRSVITVPVIAGLFVAASQAGATPPDRVDRGRADRALFTWTGRVDREVLIVVRGRDVSTRGFDAALPSRTRVNAALPRTNANVVVQLNDGRGDVDVIEQPSARNGYQAVLRVRDPRAGADNYRITAYVDDRGYDDRDGRNGRDDVYDRRDDDRGDRGNKDKGNGGGWGRGGRRDGESFPGNGRGNGRDNNPNRDDRNDRDGGYDGRGGNNGSNQNGGAGSLNWSGRVDDVVEIQISGRRVDAITRSGVRVSDVNSNIRGGGLPNRNVNLRIDQRAGRGSIAVIQQPSSWNGYTAIIRINDSRSGASYYDFTAYWE